ncbi:MAG: undecaprenyl/decaprenyl-phosphate alpha-N-acetylglucosaminyl 1-phosphate transferase [Acidimicrobiales bacterium]|nr:undecaprenyl/decaprenyl-phosphate alpha-N-acetylglucosaminyl 1-phosphate transferase [Acidimicrobiales bacterium]
MVTWVATFVVRRLTARFSIIVVPDDRRVHERATPTLGGAAMYVGLLVSMIVASQIPGLAPLFRGSSDPLGLVVAASVIFAVGMTDDLREMSAPAKLSGQILAGTVLYLFGVSMLYFRAPFLGTVVLSADLIPVMTVIWVVGMANAVNLVDGLDGLAAGIVGIAAAAFFFYSHQLILAGTIQPGSGPLFCAIVVGICVGFLPHNFHPAKIFMGDAGALMLGLLMAASTISVVGQTDQDFSGRTFFFFAPVLIPFLILGIPILDTAFAIVRRAGRRVNPAAPDKNHLHHRLMRLGHGQTRSVLILWTWTALLSGLVLYPSYFKGGLSVVPIGIAALAVALYTLFGVRGRTEVPKS